MYSTVSIKEQCKEVFCCGNKVDPQETILLLGSCRVVPYLNYLDAANAILDNKWRIYAIDPINYQIDAAGNELDTRALLKALETDEHFLSILKSVTIFIHEGLSSFGILNTLKDRESVNMYQFGMDPRVDLNIPNFHDVFILFNDFKALRPEIDLSDLWVQQSLFEEGLAHIDRFCDICEKSSFPEFARWFKNNYLEVRLFHSFNHVSKEFTLEIFRLICMRLDIQLGPQFWDEIGVHDMYANASTPVSEYDLRWRSFKFR